MCASSNDVITDAQFGFQPNLGTTEAIFVLYCLVIQTLQNKKRFYCCFVDYKKAFDSINREKLYKKLKYNGIQGKLLTVVPSMYSRIGACAKSSDCIHIFLKNVGLLQGEVLYPLFFTLYVNNLENEFTKRENTPTGLQLLSLYLLMYADDTVFFLNLSVNCKTCETHYFYFYLSVLCLCFIYIYR